MSNSNSDKINAGCLKIFKLLYLLYEDKAYYQDVVNIFKDEVGNKSANHLQVIVNKNLNALRVFGIKVKKVKNKYQLDSSLLSMKFTDEDIKSINILESVKDNFPDSATKEDLNLFLNQLAIRMSEKDKLKLSQLKTNYDFSFHYASSKSQIEIVENLCKNSSHVDIIYMKNNKDAECSGEAKEVLYTSKNILFVVADMIKNEKYIIPLSNIYQLKESPSLAARKELTTTVVYKLKNRLAKTYKLKANEYSQGFDENGNQTIVCRDEAFDVLLSRLMRYSYNCEILSPKFLREQMKELIKDTLKNYEK